MQLLICMHLESDAIFGNGMSRPGGEDISVLTDSQGFPFFKGGTLKGIFREELINSLAWERMEEGKALELLNALMGEKGTNDLECQRKLVFSDLTLHPEVTGRIQEEGTVTRQEITDMFSYLRTFTSIENGTVKDGSLRIARCIKKGLHFYGTCACQEEDAELVKDVLHLIKWVGTMRSRGFGKVRIQGEEMKP